MSNFSITLDMLEPASEKGKQAAKLFDINLAHILSKTANDNDAEAYHRKHDIAGALICNLTPTELEKIGVYSISDFLRDYRDLEYQEYVELLQTLIKKRLQAHNSRWEIKFLDEDVVRIGTGKNSIILSYTIETTLKKDESYIIFFTGEDKEWGRIRGTKLYTQSSLTNTQNG